ncbi:winged helix-turn-helix transcriptional regulator [Tetragenococcus halophilus]|uniref:SorC family transcriptional regulator n=1 Tax=Tetragenococcus halophilus (strain DSM 20338 / JCM 20259 / NCIMB 9735 / NBRC 12172) TaxID=945021 RepID=A0AAN1VQS4_TETHN|nr:sugar-binding domain-containing protein [Tetragenococcus halophilus]MCO8288643.1 winged helix-turn-helix transcriptional regulator [Tetragenococcus halophilus]MCT8309545.1 winged helix-turn-helix transcriptional regulator [Tetragenococcus halophilus]MDN6723776.1 winged helix-turn-helix transcriptional regulator [Tetragenococcus halophilus]NWN99726.1 winged helix-turn-helix transcriptional regulator [Tetragenococcus halophilus]QXN86176.1 winged helix-turn-helix transcriptional regulator [Tet
MNNRNKMIVQAALLFYKENVNQTEIAKQLNVSRPTVATLLKEAVDRGIVKISIQDSEIMNFEQQEILTKKYGLKTVLIPSATASEEEAKQEVGNLCATFIENNLHRIKNLGIGWGSTLNKFAEAASYHHFEDLSIVPLIGGVDVSNVKNQSNHLAFILSQKYNCHMDYFYAPAIAESLEMKEAFDKSQFIRDIIQKGKNVDMAIAAVGNPIESSSYRKLGYFSEEDAREMKEKNVIGDILATFFNKNGERVPTNISKKMIGVNLDDLMNIPEVVVVASGKEKAPSIQHLLKQPIIDHLIIDAEIAATL